MPFSKGQVEALTAKLDSRHVRTRKQEGLELSYIEGWHAIAEANRIFGFDGWSRETLELRCVWEGSRRTHRGERPACAYIAKVRITVRAQDGDGAAIALVVREGTGAGHGVGMTLGDAHESAIKEAETDATKRALATFGSPFGLALYDRERREVAVFVEPEADAEQAPQPAVSPMEEGETAAPSHRRAKRPAAAGPALIPVPMTADGKRSDWRAWARQFAAAVEQAANEEWLDKLVEENRVPLANLGQDRPKWLAELERRTEARRERLARLAA
jgi:hypothetical protein